MSTKTKLNQLELGQCARIASVGGEGALRQHFLDMGLIPGAPVQLVKFAPLGDPLEIRVHGYQLTLRVADAQCIQVQPTSEAVLEKASATVALPPQEHPGLGEYGRSHQRETESPLPDTQQLTFALVGNQNCGKTTLFNQLTGMNQHVGNFPGVTVEAKYGQIRGRENAQVTDLPGVYSLSPYSSEEVVSRQFILDQKPTGIINIVDATNMERNLYLTMQLMELGVPMVLALNMMDEVLGNRGSVDINAMEAALGIPVVPISALKGEGIQELVDHAIHVAKYQEPPMRQDFCAAEGSFAPVHRCLHSIMHLVEDHAQAAGVPVRFAASKLAEGDGLIASALNLSQNEQETIEHILVQMEKESGMDRAAAMAGMRYGFIQAVCDATVTKGGESRERSCSRLADKVLTGTFTAIPAFIGIMAVVFWLTFNVVGAWLQDLLDEGITALGDLVAEAMEGAAVNETLQSFVIDGIFGGVGSVVSFVPIIVVLFFFLSLLEDSGYMTRVAFVMDKLLRKIGLSGRSIVPMLIGFGCSVPAIMASRTLPSERDRKMTIMLTPFMSCSAKLPIYAFFTEAFFPENAALVMVGLYVLGIAVGILVALVSKQFAFRGQAVPFVMELPNYRLPSVRSTGMLLWDKTWDFLRRAFTIIFLATMVVWFLQTFDFGLNVVEDAAESMLALVSSAVAPVFAPLGFGDWRVATALVTGFIAKESVVATLSVLFGSLEALQAALSLAAAGALLVFCLLYTPCAAAIASVRRELGGKWAAGMVVFQCAVAWVVALAAHGVLSVLL